MNEPVIKTVPKLSELQQKFTQMVGQLIQFAYISGYGLTFGDAYRSQQQANWNAQNGFGIRDSLHCDRLAVDFNLFKDGTLLTGVTDYELLGQFWENLGGTWGGRFTRPDAYHFSVAYNGRK